MFGKRKDILRDKPDKKHKVTKVTKEATKKQKEPSPLVEEQPQKPQQPIHMETHSNVDSKLLNDKKFLDKKERIHKKLLAEIDLKSASQMQASLLRKEIEKIIRLLVKEEKLTINKPEERALINIITNDMVGLGPLEPLIADELITDIMVNGPDQVYIERAGKLQLTDVKFNDEQHLYNIAQRIVNAIGRRVDESSPICDARLADGSRVNVITTPLSLKGTSISIRKFSEKKITLDVMAKQNNISADLATILKIAGKCRLNIIISGGTGSGKTTMLNAISQMIDNGERIVTIEDAAELQLLQPHVVPLETRPPSLEGGGEITMRDLVKNSLRMRPDRIILGEVRGAEAIDMLQAMNTGHDGSMCTLHANNPREAMMRLENMVQMAGMKLSEKAIRTQIASAAHLIVQVSRMRDGMRRVTHVTEVVGMEGDVVVMQDLFKYEYEGEDTHGNLIGEFKGMGVKPHFAERARYFGLDSDLMKAIG